MGTTIFFLALFIVPTWRSLAKDYKRGFLVSITLFSFMTNRLSISAGPFELTFPRILIVVLAIYWWRWRRAQPALAKPPFMGFMKFWLAAAVCSMIFTEVPEASIKWMISFVTEVFLFYIIVGTTIQTEDDLLRTYKAVCVATSIVAIMGLLEYYYGFAPVQDWMGIYIDKDWDDILTTFQHRILFGYAVAMGWPLLLALAFRTEDKKKRRILLFLSGAALCCGYFSNSRGPWFGCAIGGVVMGVLGSKMARKTMLTLAALSIVVLIIKPGVRDTLVSLTMSTFDPDSYRGESYEYRKILWPLAFKLIGESPKNLIFGCGPLALESKDLHMYLKVGGNPFRTGWTSWDNNNAANLAEFGIVGFGAEILMYLAVVVTLARYAFKCPPERRDIYAAMTAAVVVYLFALTNVYMFSPQLKCIFLTLAIMIGRMVSLPSSVPVAGNVASGQPLGAQPAAAPSPG